MKRIVIGAVNSVHRPFEMGCGSMQLQFYGESCSTQSWFPFPNKLGIVLWLQIIHINWRWLEK